MTRAWDEKLNEPGLEYNLHANWSRDLQYAMEPI